MFMTDNFEYHNVVDILMFNDKGEIALQMRASNDKSFPGHWDFSAGGHIDHGETADVAAKREMFEEIGVDGQPIFISKVQFKYQAWNSTIMRLVDVHIYKVIYNGTFNIDSAEVEKISFFSMEKIQKMIDEGQKFHPEFLLTWNNKELIKSICDK